MTKRKRVPEYFRSKKSVYVPGKKQQSSDVFARTGAVAGFVASSSGASSIVAGATSMWNSIPPAYIAAAEALAGDVILEDVLVAAALSGPVVAGAVAAAAGVGYLAGMAIDSMFSQTNTPIGTIFNMSGYSGKFALSAKKSSQLLRDKFQKRGAVTIEENYGTVADPEILYIGQSTYNIDSIVNAISICILRKLFRVGIQCDVKTPYEELPLVAALPPDSGPSGYRIVYITQDSDGTEAVHNHNIPNDISLSQMATLNFGSTFILNDSIRESIASESPKSLQKVYLYQVDLRELTAPGYKLVCQMDMAREKLEIVMSSHMVIQNRTRSAAGSVETTVIDAQPLKGPVYEFSTGVPKLRGEGPFAIQNTRPQGIILVRGAELGGSNVIAYNEPPVRNVFQSVVKSGYVRLGPGAMKSMNCSASCQGFFNTVLFKLRYTNENGVVSRAYGKSQMLCIEEELNSGSANNITLSYECQHICGAQLTTTSNPNMQPLFKQSNINNIPG